ncbi:hypothetical protein [Brochothrix thermosphacta]|uniref:hypothetical protein n=1 Tax=Brochothrix thermosphacta TaxID=2756 RepID=UPI00083F8195|nr:hypothetical protein [Brochothrix thermosphacta]ODJ71164.1 hypothetical protein BFR43_04720 [Brochothrix thermosphacta]
MCFVYQHVWGYFKRVATPEERALSASFSTTADELRPFLRELTVKYLLSSALLFATPEKMISLN